jgi:hypothetical protein
MLYVCSIEEVEALWAQARRVGRVDAGRGVLWKVRIVRWVRIVERVCI